MPNQKLYDDFEKRLTDELVKLCTGNEMLEGELLASDDIDEVLNNMLSGYLEDALREFDQYPEAAVAFAGYVGMAVACWVGRGLGGSEEGTLSYSIWQARLRRYGREDYRADSWS